MQTYHEWPRIPGWGHVTLPTIHKWRSNANYGVQRKTQVRASVVLDTYESDIRIVKHALWSCETRDTCCVISHDTDVFALMMEPSANERVCVDISATVKKHSCHSSNFGYTCNQWVRYSGGMLWHWPVESYCHIKHGVPVRLTSCWGHPLGLCGVWGNQVRDLV